jgi:hypothetical protein
MSNAKLKKEALAHYDRMIAWVEKQPAGNESNHIAMFIEIGERYYGDHCPYCQKYGDSIYECQGCELRGSEELGTACCDGLWNKMVDAKTWKTWLKYAKLVKEYIEKNG